MMPARRIALVLAAILVVAGCGNQTGPRFSIQTRHLAQPVTIARLVCVSQDCGPYAATIHWAGISIASQTGYYVYKDAEQVADVATATYTFHGIDCGASFTVGVRAHNGAGGTSSLYTTSYTAPSCGGGAAPVNQVAPYFCGSTSPSVAANTDAIGGCTSLTGDAVSGQTLRVGTGVWTNSPTSFTYQWYSCTTTSAQPPTTASCSSLGSGNGAQTSAYAVQAGDVGKSLVPVVTAYNGGTASTPTTVSGSSCNHGSTPGGNGGTGFPPATLQWDPVEPAGCSPISAVAGTSTDTTTGTPMRFCTNSPVTCGYADPLAGNAGVPPGTTLSTQSSLTCSSGTTNAVYVTGAVSVSGTCHITNSRLTAFQANSCTSCVFTNDEIAGSYTGRSAATTGTGRMANVAAQCDYSTGGGGNGNAFAVWETQGPNSKIPTIQDDYLHCATETLNGDAGQSVTDNYIIADECYAGGTGSCNVADPGPNDTTHAEAVYEYGGQSNLHIDHNVLLNPFAQTAGVFTDSPQPVSETLNQNLAATYDNNGALLNSYIGSGSDSSNDPVNNNRFSYIYNADMNCGNGSTRDGPNAPFVGNIDDNTGNALTSCGG